MKGGLCAAALVAAGVGACGSITRGTSEPVTFISEPSGASVTTPRKYACPSTPCTLDVDRSDEFDATFTLPGYRPETIPVRTKVATRGAVGMAGNVLAGGLIGVGVDAYTGAALDHEPNPVVARLTPLSPARVAAPTRRRGPGPDGPGT
ncbi:translation initiation factor 2 [Methylobacterium durans]|uniref:translation initiation factor 2 n=1 Tax=Methylobacterium durans TaxID=2202825 RepID=UPI003C6CECEB